MVLMIQYNLSITTTSDWRVFCMRSMGNIHYIHGYFARFCGSVILFCSSVLFCCCCFVCLFGGGGPNACARLFIGCSLLVLGCGP